MPHKSNFINTAKMNEMINFMLILRHFIMLLYYIALFLLSATLCFSQSTDVKRAIEEYTELPATVKNALLDTVKKSALDKVLICEADGIIATIVLKTTPPKNVENYSRIHSLYVSQANAQSFAAICQYVAFREKSLLIRFSDKELLLKALKHVHVSGSVKGAFHKTQTIGREVITIACCPFSNIKATLNDPQYIENIAEQYLHAGHDKIKKAIMQKNHHEAIKTWKHLKKSNLFSPQLVVDIAECYMKMNAPDECIRHCKEFERHYKDLSDKGFFIRLADILADIQDEEAEALANSFYDRAEELLEVGKKKTTNP